MKFVLTVAENTKQLPTMLEVLEKTKNWGKDHWSLLAYFETRCVDHMGRLDTQHMRCNAPVRGFTNGNPRSALGAVSLWEPTWGTRLKDGTIPDTEHDDWSVMEELEELGFCENINSNLNPVIRLTDLGRKTCNALRIHKSEGKTFNQFSLQENITI